MKLKNALWLQTSIAMYVDIAIIFALQQHSLHVDLHQQLYLIAFDIHFDLFEIRCGYAIEQALFHVNFAN